MTVYVDGSTGADTIGANTVSTTKIVDGAVTPIKMGGASGEICWFAMSTAPAGFLKANGSAVSRTTYAALFAAIGTTFGVGDGSTTFNVPDLRGEFVRSWDDGRGVDSGRAIGSAQADAFKSHQHTSFLYNGGSSVGVGAPATNIADNNGQLTGATGGTETRPRNIALLACIRF
jgi:hypothetical protein